MIRRLSPQFPRDPAGAANGYRKGDTALVLNWWRAVTPFALMALILSLAAVPAWSQSLQLTVSNAAPLEGPGATTDAVLVYASGLQGSAKTTVNVSTNADWITLLTTNIQQNGPNRLRFQLAANTGATQTGLIVLTPTDGSPATTITVTQAGAGFVSAAPTTIITSITGPKGIDVDPQGNLYIVEVNGTDFYEWNATVQELVTVTYSRPKNTFVDVAADAAGDVFALENTPEYGSQVEKMRDPQGAPIPPQSAIFFSSNANQYFFPMGLCVDTAGRNLIVAQIAVSDKCLYDQFGTVYELGSTTTDLQGNPNENVGYFTTAPSSTNYTSSQLGKTIFPVGTYVDVCGNTLSGVSGSLYGLSKDGNGFIYFVDKGGTRLNRYDPAAPWYTCTPPQGTLISKNLDFGNFTTVANLNFVAFYTAADAIGNIYLSSMPFSQILEIPRAYVFVTSQTNLPAGGASGQIQVLPSTQNLSGVFAPTSSDTSWLNVTSAANGVVSFSVAPNPGPSRTGIITVLGVPVNVVEGSTQVPSGMAIISGNNQTLAVGGLLTFPTNLLVKVTNQFGEAVANAPIQFTSATQQTSTTSDARGYASTTGFFRAYAAGPIYITASIPGTSVSQTFTEYGIGTTGISVISGSNQQAQTSVGVFGNMEVQVIGANAQPAAGVPVTFTAPSGGGASGTFSASSAGLPVSSTSVTVTTDINGLAQLAPNIVFVPNGVAGSYTVTAAVGAVAGLTSSSCVFNLSNYAPYTELVGNQAAFVSSAYASPLALRLNDTNGNPVANASVQFVVGTGQGTSAAAVFSDSSQSTMVTTGTDGIATALPMTANSIAGSFTASAFITLPNGGGTLTASWTLTNLSSAIVEGGFQTGTASRTLAQPFIVKASANATAGTMVFSVVPGPAGASGSFNGQNSVTVNLDSQGYGISPQLTANTSPGTFYVLANDGITTVQSTITTTPCLNPYSPSVSVTSLGDYDPLNPASIDTGSLRYALANACAGSIINMTPVAGTISLGSRLRLDDNMTILGPGAGNLAIDGAHKTRLFFIGNGSVSMSGLTLQNGLAQGGGSMFGGAGAGMGGAIFMEGGDLTLSSMTFTGNEALGGTSGTTTPCTTNCSYGGGGFAGDAQPPEQGGSSGDLLGLSGLSNGASGDIGGGGAAAGLLNTDTSVTGGNGGFGAGGGTGPVSSGNGGFGGGGGGASSFTGTNSHFGGFGGGNGYETENGSAIFGFGGSGAGFGGAIFEYAGQLTLTEVQFFNNSAVGGTLAGLSGQPASLGQGKGGALFIYNGAVFKSSGSTFGTSANGQANVAADAGLPGSGNSTAPYTNGATCPGQDTVDVCGTAGSGAPVTISAPFGFQFSIDGVSYSGSQALTLSQGQHTLAAGGPQATGAGTQLAFSSWSDGGAPSHTITVGPGGLSLTGTLATQYLLTTSAGAGGLTVSPSSGYYNAGSVVNLNAVPIVGNVFINWTGTVAAANSAATTVTMFAPETVTANFAAAQMVNVTVPGGVSFTLNGANYTGPQFVSLGAGQYTLSATSPQVSALGDQEAVFNSWSDGGALSHTITVGSSNLAITGSFTTQYQLTANAGSGGTIAAVSGFYSPGTVVNLTATPNTGFVFHNWAGPVASPASATTTVTMSQAETVVANFWPVPSACVAAPANVTAWWKGDGTANDETTLYNATLIGDVSFAPGLVGQAFSFDGTRSPYVSLPASVFPAQPGNGAFSFETWFQTSGGNGGVILGQQPYVAYTESPADYVPAIYVGTDGNLYVEMFYNGSVNPTVGSVPVNDNQWHHVAVTYDGSSEIVYLDGTNIAQTPFYPQVAIGSPLSYQLGTGYSSGWPATNNGWYTFNGLIDESTTYSRALTAAEVLGIAQAGRYGKCDPGASVNPATLVFPTTAPGQNTVLSAQISNTGNAPLSITDIELDKGDTQFSILTGALGDCLAGNSVEAGSYCNVRVLSPQVNGAVSGSVTITDNSVVLGGTQVIQLAHAQTTTFTAPSSAVYGSTFTPVVTTNSGVAANVTAMGSCQINGTQVTMTAGTGICELVAIWPAHPPYALTTALLVVNAVPASLTASVMVANKTFDGTKIGALNGCILSNVLAADAGNVTCSAANVTFASAGVGNNIPVTVTGLTLGGSAAANYQLSVTTAAATANITASGIGAACVAAPANVAAWWKGDGNPNDETTLYDAALGGDVSFAPGLVGQAFSFDGTQSPYVSLPAGAFPPQPGSGAFSFEAWFQTAGGNGGVILGQQPTVPYAASLGSWSPAIYVGTDGKLYVEMFFGGSIRPAVSAASVNDNQWHHVAVTFDGSSEIPYLDGANIGPARGWTQAPNGSPLSYQLGTGYTNTWPATNNGWYTFNGLIDEATVYSRALTAAEVLSIAGAGSSGKCDPVAAVNPGTLAFPTMTAVGQSSVQTAQISNNGNAPLTITNIALDNGDTQFTTLTGASGDCAAGTPVAANTSCNVRVQFSPQSTGVVSGTVSISDNSVVLSGTQLIQLSNSGLNAPVVTFTGPAGAAYGSTFTPLATTNSSVAAVVTATGPCQINGTLVTMSAGAGVCQLQAVWPANPPYAAATATLNVNAVPAAVTATVTVANKPFDGTTTATLSGCTLSNVLLADAGNVTCSAASATFASAGVANNITVTVTGLTLGGSAAGNYELSAITATTTANITSTITSTGSACVAAPSGVTAWWKAEGNANDVTGAYNATLGGDVSFAPGLVGQAFSFDGAQSPYISFPAGALPVQPSNGPFSFETWFQTSTGGVILGQQSGPVYAANPSGWAPGVYVGTNGILYVQMFNSTEGIEPVQSNNPVNDGQWHHVAVTYNGAQENVYLDGVNIGLIPYLVQTTNATGYELGTGYTQNWPASNNGWYTFNGLIDEPTLYSSALTATEVSSIAQAGSAGKCDSAVVINPGTLSFPLTGDGNSATLTSQISNVGNAPLTISSIALDAGDTNFTVLSGNPGDCAAGTPVAVDASCNVRVQFSPQGNGAVSGSVSITDNSLLTSGTQVIQLSGSAPTIPVVTFTGPSSVVYGSTFTPVATTNSGVTAVLIASGPCAINGTQVAMTAGAGICQLQAVWPANPPYSLATATLTVNATPVSVTATVTVANKTFDGTTTATLSGCILSNVLPADASKVTCTAASATFASAGVDNNIPVTVTGLTLGGSAAGNYQLSATTATTTANITFSSTDSACVAAPAGLTAWWKADGNANDASGMYNATLGGDVSFAAGKVGQAFSFDGTQSPYVSLPASAFPAQPSNLPFSFETWFQTSTGGVILGQQPYAPYAAAPQEYVPAIYVGTDGKLYVEMFYNGNTNPSVSPVVVNDNQWHHVAATYDGSSEIVYLDGANIAQTSSYSQVPNGSPLSYQLGTGYTLSWPATNNGWYTFNGLIDEPTVYSRALTPAEVANIVQAEGYGKCNPVALVSPTTLAFPNVTDGQSASLSAQITNPGNAPLSISSIALDANDTNFTVLTGTPGDCAVSTPVAPNNSCNVRVAFAPQSAGSLTGQIAITDNSVMGGGVQTIGLSGSGTLPGTITLVANPTSATQGDAVLLTATVSGNPVPTGTVTFSHGGTVLGSKTLNASGVATLTTMALPLGTDNLTARYAGNAKYPASTSNVVTETISASAGAPAVVSLSPTSGSGATQTFTAVYSDPNGAADLATLRLLFNTAVNGANACYVKYYPATNLLYLENDGNTALSAGVAPGSAGSVSNSQCTLSGTGSSYNASGKTATLSVALTFTATLPTNIYLYASEANATASTSGWIKLGTWGASAGAPTVVSLSPTSGSGATQTFTAVYSDPNGAADLATVRLLFNTDVTGAHACYVFYYPTTKLLYLENDGGTGLSAGITPGSSGTVSNSQCTLSGAGSSYSASGNTATLNVALSFNVTLPVNIYPLASEANVTDSNSGWVKMGTWGAYAGPPTVVSLSPNAGSAAAQTFTAVYSDPNGAADLATLRLLFNTAVNGANACYVKYYPATNLLYLENDGNTALSAGVAPGSVGSVSNSQCTLSGTGSSYNASGKTATLSVALTFTATLPTNIYLYASEANATASTSGWIKLGIWGP